MYIPIYRKWWFWVGVVVLCVGVVVLKWQVVMTPAEEENQIRNTVQQAYYDIMTKRGEDMVTKQKADTYGGDTPEETLRLFVEALEKKDYELASKYYVVEEQNIFLNDSNESKNVVGYKDFVNAYKKESDLKSVRLGSSGGYEIEIDSKNINAPYRLRFRENEYTKKWKLTDK